MHTGSMLVRNKQGSICNKKGMESFADLYVIDPEFAFYGPVSFDIGNVIAHLFFAQAFNIYNTKCELAGNISLYQYRAIPESFITFFETCAKEKLRNILNEKHFKDEKFVERYVQDILIESIHYAGIELIRRIVGSAKVPDLTQLPYIHNRMLMERQLIEIAVKMILYTSDKQNPRKGLIEDLLELD